MVADTRSLLPTDLLALLAYGSTSSYRNRSWPRERLGAGEAQPTIKVLRDQVLAFSGQRTAWVSLRRQRLQALVGARRRGTTQAWEVDYLVDCGAGRATLVDLLESLVQDTAGHGAEKLFLRLDVDCPLLAATQEAGFVVYQEETLYRLQGEIDAAPAEARRAAPVDSYPLFRLYTSVVPEATRRFEAATYGEWQAAMERRWLKNGVQLIAEQDDAIFATVRASRLDHGLMLDLTLRSEAAGEVPGLISAAAREMQASRDTLLTLVPSTNQTLAYRLEDAGFDALGEFVSLVRRTTRPLSLPRAVPAVAKNVVGA